MIIQTTSKLKIIRMGLLDIFRKSKEKQSSNWKDEDKRKIIEKINAHNKEIEVVREEVFSGEGKPYRYFHPNNNVRAEGFYYALGYDKRDQVKNEKFQGKNVEYHENGQIKDIFYYKDGIATGEYYSYDHEGSLIFSQPVDSSQHSS
jgi:antitoxin component YwqK of YwqJK toxin-antitoxin module